MTVIFWDTPPHSSDKWTADISGVGRYLIERRTKGARDFILKLNGERTPHHGSVESLKQTVERLIAERQITPAARPAPLKIAAKRSTLMNALLTAAEIYDSAAREHAPSNDRLHDQFTRQAREVRALAEQIEQADQIALED